VPSSETACLRKCHSAASSAVNGQWVLPSGGHEISPLAVSRPA